MVRRSYRRWHLIRMGCFKEQFCIIFIRPDKHRYGRITDFPHLWVRGGSDTVRRRDSAAEQNAEANAVVRILYLFDPPATIAMRKPPAPPELAQRAALHVPGCHHQLSLPLLRDEHDFVIVP